MKKVIQKLAQRIQVNVHNEFKKNVCIFMK